MEHYFQEIKGTWTTASLKWWVLVQNLKQVLIMNTKHAVKEVFEITRVGCLAWHYVKNKPCIEEETQDISSNIIETCR